MFIAFDEWTIKTGIELGYTLAPSDEGLAKEEYCLALEFFPSANACRPGDLETKSINLILRTMNKFDSLHRQIVDMELRVVDYPMNCFKIITLFVKLKDKT